MNKAAPCKTRAQSRVVAGQSLTADRQARPSALHKPQTGSTETWRLKHKLSECLINDPMSRGRGAVPGRCRGGCAEMGGREPCVPLMCDDQKDSRPAHAQGMRGAGEQARGYPSDLTDAQWQVIAPHLPAEVPGRRGRPRIWPLRAIIDAILYVDRAGCPWRYLPDSFPPWPTVYGYFAGWRDDGTLARLHDALRAQVRAAAGRDPEPTAAIIDSQSVRAADTVPKATRGWDNAKK